MFRHATRKAASLLLAGHPMLATMAISVCMTLALGATIGILDGEQT